MSVQFLLPFRGLQLPDRMSQEQHMDTAIAATIAIACQCFVSHHLNFFTAICPSFQDTTTFPPPSLHFCLPWAAGTAELNFSSCVLFAGSTSMLSHCHVLQPLCCIAFLFLFCSHCSHPGQCFFCFHFTPVAPAPTHILLCHHSIPVEMHSHKQLK